MDRIQEVLDLARSLESGWDETIRELEKSGVPLNMADVTGARGTGNISADTREIDMGQRITLLEPESAPLTVLTKRIRTIRAIDPQFNWLEDAREPRFDAINAGAGYDTDDTELTVDNGSYFAEHQLVKNTRTTEIFRVVSVAGNVLSVIRGVGNSGTGVAMNDNDELVILSTAQPEGDTSRDARTSNPTKVTNYTQIFRNSWEVTGTLRASTPKVQPKDWNHQAHKVGIEHALDIEYALLFGKADENLTGGQPRRTTGGVLDFVTTNSQDAGGAFTEAELATFMRTNFRYGSRRKVMLAAPLVVSVMNAFAQGKLETRQGESTFGLAVMKYVSPFGTIDMVTHWLLEGTIYGGYGILLDLDELAWRPLSNEDEHRDTKVRKEIQENDRDGRKDEYLTEGGLQVGHEQKHGLLTGVTS